MNKDLNDLQFFEKKGAKTFNRLAILIVFLALAQVLAPTTVVLLSNLLPSAFRESEVLPMIVSYIAMYVIVLPIGLFFFKGFSGPTDQPKKEKPEKVDFKLISLVFPFAFALMTLTNILAALFQTHVIGKNGSVDLASTTSSGGILFSIILGVIIAPIMEELIFRYLPFKKAGHFGLAPYVLWTAVVFGLFHFNFGQSIYAAVLGIVLGLVMYKTRNVLNSIILHVLINFTGAMGLGAIVTNVNSEMLTNVYSIFIIVVIIIGIICGIFLVKKKMLSVDKSLLPKEKLPIHKAFLNPGTIIFIIFALGMIILAFLY